MEAGGHYLEDPPMTCKWLNSHGDRFRPLSGATWDPFQMAYSWLINRGDPNHLQVLG